MPSRVLTNADLEKMVDTSDEWIVERTGIRERRIVANGELQSDLSFFASKEALDRIGYESEQIDQIIVATVTPDHIFPSSSNTLAAKLGVIGPPSVDIVAACSGFIYALHFGVCAIESGRADRVLVVGSEVMSSIVDWKDRNTCVLFGDAAGAVLLEPVDHRYGIFDIYIGSDGREDQILKMEAGGSALPASYETVEKRQHFVKMNGPEVFKIAVRKMDEVASLLLERNRLKPHDVRLFIFHQANLRIIEAVGKRLGIKPSQLYNNIESYGNTTSATIPTCLYEAEAEKRIRRGDLVMVVTFGAGLTWGGALMRWAIKPLPKSSTVSARDQQASDYYSDRLRPDREWRKT